MQHFKMFVKILYASKIIHKAVQISTKIDVYKVFLFIFHNLQSLNHILLKISKHSPRRTYKLIPKQACKNCLTKICRKKKTSSKLFAVTTVIKSVDMEAFRKNTALFAPHSKQGGSSFTASIKSIIIWQHPVMLLPPLLLLRRRRPATSTKHNIMKMMRRR